MPDLAHFQDAFAEALLAPEPEGRLARAPGFAVYRNTCVHGIVEALRAAYPTVDCLLGEEGFTAAALGFRAEQPPASPVLSRYGAAFPGFLARQPWTSELPYLADVAMLDRLWLDAHLAADSAALHPPSASASFQPLRLTLHPAARFAWLDTPAVTIWLAHRIPDGFDDLAPEWQPEGALVTRLGAAAMLQPIGRTEHRLLAAIAGGAPVSRLGEALGREADLPALIARLIACGAVLPI